MKKLFGNYNAFTLIEVITTITILSIVMAIAVASIDGLIQSSKKERMLVSANKYVDAINLAIVSDGIEQDHKVIQGSKYQEYIESNSSLDIHSDVLIEDSEVRQANFCFEDGLVVYSNGKYETYLNDDCTQKVVSDTIVNAMSLDKENKTEGVPVFQGIKNNESEKSPLSGGYTEAPYKLYMVNDDVEVSPTANISNAMYCDINSSNCDYRCIGGTFSYDEKGMLQNQKTCKRLVAAPANQKEFSLSWDYSLEQSLNSYLALKNNKITNTARRHLDYLLSSDGLTIGTYNPYLYKSFCNNYNYGNSEVIYNYCNTLETTKRKLTTSSNYLETKHIIMNGLIPYLVADFSATTSVEKEEVTILDDDSLKYDIKEYIKYGAVDFSSSNKDSSIQQKIDNIKSLVANKGGVIIIVGYGKDLMFYDKDQNIIYQPFSSSDSVVDQTLTVIGWDDNKEINGKKGAWITMNSRGAYANTKAEEAQSMGVNIQGFTFVSYYDYGYLSNEHYAFTKIDDITENSYVYIDNNKDDNNDIDTAKTKVYSIYNSSYEQVQGTTSHKLENVVGKEYATNIVFDRINSNNYDEYISQIKIFNEFSIETAYKIYLKENEVYKEIGFVHFKDNESGIKTIELHNKKIKLNSDNVDIVVTISNSLGIQNLVFMPEDIAIYTNVTNIDEVEIKLLKQETVENGTKYSILTSGIPTGEKLQISAENWKGNKVTVGMANNFVINDYVQTVISLPTKEKHYITIGYNDKEYTKILINEWVNAKPSCSFSSSSLTIKEEYEQRITLTCIDDTGIRSSKLYKGWDLITTNSYFAPIKSISSPTCSKYKCSWTIVVEGNKKGNANLRLSSGAVQDETGLGNTSVTLPITVR